MPHRFRYWLTEVQDSHREEKIVEGCELYREAKARDKEGEKAISMDDMTHVQAVERLHPDLPMQPGHVVRREFEYIRHGTLTCFLNVDIFPGKVIAP